MPLFSYQAKNQQGQIVSATVEAETYEQAWRAVESEGLQPLSIAGPAAPGRGNRLGGPASAEVARQIAEITTSGLPLVAGLRAAATESSRPAVTRALVRLADEVERGVPLAEAVADTAGGFPSFIRGLVGAAASTGQLGIALDELVSHYQSVRRIWRELAASLAYPALVMSMAVTILGLLFVYVVPQFKTMFESFGLELPAMTIAMIRISDFFVLLTSGVQKWFTISGIASLAASIVVIRLVLGSARWHWLMSTMPLVGPLWSWSGAAAFSRSLAVLVDNQIPLPAALSLAGQGLRQRNVRQACELFAAGVQSGSRLSELLADSQDLPQSLVPFVEYGESHGQLADSLRVASDVFLDRLGRRASLLQSISPAIIFVVVTLTILLCFVGMIMPLVDLIQGLV